jgi:hypothetical protein
VAAALVVLPWAAPGLRVLDCFPDAEVLAAALLVAAAGLVAGADELVAVAPGAVRANRVAMPTVASALSWVARQVSLPRRRNPASRASVGDWGSS